MGTIPELLTLLPCPFCGGPPVASVFNLLAGRIMRPGEINPKGECAEAYVWCHECGAQGSAIDGFVYDRGSYNDLELEGAKAWNERGSKNGVLYEAERAKYPRPV